MKDRIVSERYASALLNVAKKRGEAEHVFEEMVFLKNVLNGNLTLRRFLEGPHITQEDKMSLIKKAFGEAVTGTAMTFLLLLVRKYRLKSISEIIDAYEKLYDIDMSVQRTEVITAYPLNDDSAGKLRAAVETAMGKSVKMCFSVDPKILGGVVIKTPNLIIDGSIRRKLRDLSYSIMALKV
ncbi:MAG TPA: ATP synthase F1 subunit delta [Nitrospirota bacterium]|nr:ATP synthase F1 subunit delta [Nitrospirota bacterium]